MLNEQCIKNVTVTKSFERKPFAVKTTFTNRKSWAVDTFYQTKDGLISSAAAYGERKIILENAPKWITEFDHAYKYTRRQLAKQQLQPREITVQVGHDGDYYPLYSKIILQMKQLQIGLSVDDPPKIAGRYTLLHFFPGINVYDIFDGIFGMMCGCNRNAYYCGYGCPTFVYFLYNPWIIFINPVFFCIVNINRVSY